MSKYSKRHFTVVIKNKENGLYISSTPSSAAKKAVSKLCASNKNKKVEFHIREITRDSKKKTYGPYIGYLEKLKIPIKLKEYIIKYNPVAKLKKKSTMKKIRMIGGTKEFIKNSHANRGSFLIEIDENIKDNKDFGDLLFNLISESKLSATYILIHRDKKKIEFNLNPDITEELLLAFLNNQDNKNKIIEKMKELRIRKKIIITLQIPYMVNNKVEYEVYLYMEYDPTINSNFPSNNINLQPSNQFQTPPNQFQTPKNNKNNKEEENDYQKRYKKLKNMIEEGRILDVYLNNALKFFLEQGFRSLYHIFYCFLNEKTDSIKNRKIISVGSGNAYFEFIFKEIFDIPEIICIDPNPRSFLPAKNGPFIQPTFSTVDDLTSSNNSNTYNDSLLILNWVFPGDDSYDVDAIKKLKPIRIFIIYEDTGAAGSKNFHLDFKIISKPYTSYIKHEVTKNIYYNRELIQTLIYVIQCYKRS